MRFESKDLSVKLPVAEGALPLWAMPCGACDSTAGVPCHQPSAAPETRQADGLAHLRWMLREALEHVN